MMKRRLPVLFSCALAGILGASVAVQADFHGHFPGFFQDDFDRPDSEDVGDGWSEVRGSWSLIEGRVIPVSDGTEDKILAFENVELVEYPFVVSADMAGLSDARWGGLAFHIQPFSPSDNYYSLIARVESTSSPGVSAIQFRRYNWGVGTTLASHILPEDLTLNETFRYTVISKEPGVFELMVDKLDQETGAVTDNLIVFTVTETEFTGGQAGFHANAADDRLAYSRFVINSQELTETVAGMEFHDALAVSYTPEPGRVTSLEHSPNLMSGWSPLMFPGVSQGDPVSRLFSLRFTDREFFRVVSDL